MSLVADLAALTRGASVVVTRNDTTWIEVVERVGVREIRTTNRTRGDAASSGRYSRRTGESVVGGGTSIRPATPTEVVQHNLAAQEAVIAQRLAQAQRDRNGYVQSVRESSARLARMEAEVGKASTAVDELEAKLAAVRARLAEVGNG